MSNASRAAIAAATALTMSGSALAAESAVDLAVTAERRAAAPSVYEDLERAPAAPVRAEGSLYPPGAKEVSQSPLAKALGAASTVLADIGPSESFAAELRRAIGLHPVFHREASRRAELRARKRGERSALYPRISANLSGDYVIAREFGAGTENVVESLKPEAQFNAGLSVSQLVFDGGAAFQRIRGASAMIREQDANIEARINELALSGLSAYHDLAAHQALIRLGDDYIRRHENLVAQVAERERLGAGSRADLMQARARLAAAKARVSNIRESARLAEIRYAEFFKAEPGPLARPSFEAVVVGTREEASVLAVARHPEIGAAAARSDRARAEFKAARASRLPELRARIDATKFDVFDRGNDDYDLRAGVAMQYDLFAGGARGAAISQTREAANQQRYDEDRIRQEIERDAQIAFERREASAERLAVLGDAVVAHAEARGLVSERFRASRGQLIDVLQAENDYFEAAVAYVAAQADRDMATYGVMEHTGDLLRHFSPSPDHARAGEDNG